MNADCTVSRRAFLALGAGAVASALAGCSPTHVAYSLGTAEHRGFFNEFGNLLAKAVDVSHLSFSLDPRVTTGSEENLRLLKASAIDLAMALPDEVDDTSGLFAVGRVYLTYAQFAVPHDSPIRSVADLRGKTVSLGNASGTSHLGRRVLEAAGLTEADVHIHPVPLTGVLESLADGTISAALFAGGVPHPAVDPNSGPGPKGGIRLIDLSSELAVMRDRYGPVYEQAIVPRGIYGASSETVCIGVASLLLARGTLADDVVGRIVDVLIDRSSDLVPSGTLGVQYLDPRSLVYTFGIPLHPGAAAAYRTRHG